MGRIIRSCVATLAILGTTAAQANCWSPQAVTAAKIRNFDTMLMVSALRCRTSNSNFMASYGAFMNQNRGSLVVAGLELQKHFGSASGYDHYAISVANHYGAGVQGMSCADLASITESARSAAMTAEQIADLAERSGVDPMLDAATCDTVAGR